MNEENNFPLYLLLTRYWSHLLLGARGMGGCHLN